MNIGDAGLAILLSVLSLPFAIGAVQGLRRREVWIPNVTEDNTTPPWRVPPKHRRILGIGYAIIAVALLAFALRFALRAFAGA
jgi:hypothetical protein